MGVLEECASVASLQPRRQSGRCAVAGAGAPSLLPSARAVTVRLACVRATVVSRGAALPCAAPRCAMLRVHCERFVRIFSSPSVCAKEQASDDYAQCSARALILPLDGSENEGVDRAFEWAQCGSAQLSRGCDVCRRTLPANNRMFESASLRTIRWRRRAGHDAQRPRSDSSANRPAARLTPPPLSATEKERAPPAGRRGQTAAAASLHSARPLTHRQRLNSRSDAACPSLRPPIGSARLQREPLRQSQVSG